jgi:hypothetical protein
MCPCVSLPLLFSFLLPSLVLAFHPNLLYTVSCAFTADGTVTTTYCALHVRCVREELSFARLIHKEWVEQCHYTH